MNEIYFKRRPDIVSLIIVLAHFTIVIGPVYLSAIWGPGYHLIVAWLIFGMGMNGIVNLMHECAHYHVFKNKQGSNILGKYVIAPLLFTNFEIYRKRHWGHHKHLGVEGETKDAYLIAINGGHVLFLLVRCLLLIEAVKKFLKQTNSAVTDELHEGNWTWLLWTILVQSLFYLSLIGISYVFVVHDVSLALRNATVAYVLVYLYGVMSLTVFAADLRAIAEHQIYPNSDAHEGYAALRNFKCNPLTRFIMGAYGFGEHYTHHKIPGIPYYALEKATEDFSKEDNSLVPRKGYFRTISEIIRSPSTVSP